MRGLRLALGVALVCLLVWSSGAGLGVAGQGDEPEHEGGALEQAPPSLDAVTKLISHTSSLFGKTRKWGLPRQWFKLMSHMTNLLPQEHGLPHQMTPELFRWFAHVYR